MSASYDFRAPRLFVESDLCAGTTFTAEPAQVHYLINVMRLKAGRSILAFNGRHGEWRTEISNVSRRSCDLTPIDQTRQQSDAGDIHYLFAPVKRARLDFLVQKATELGASVLQPVVTRHTMVERIKRDRLTANVVEAAEQCGILSVPDVRAPERLDRLLQNWDSARRLVFCDEGAPIQDPIAALQQIGKGPLAVLIGPEGGFSEDERKWLTDKKFVTAISLGPRIMRADTAAIAALTLIQAVLGDLGRDNF